MELKGKKVLIVGAGRTGLAVARFAKSRGAHVSINDLRTRAELGDAALQVENVSDACFWGSHPLSEFVVADLIVVSPGVPNNESLKAAAQNGVEIVSEVELASRFIKGQLVAITGTNGKSTVTTMVGQICEQSGLATFIGGNLGAPMIQSVGTDAAKAGGVVVAELSSFQLERISRFTAHIAVLLNISDDHLDRYENVQTYAETKSKIFSNQSVHDHAVLPYGMPQLGLLADRGEGQRHFFGGQGQVRVEDGVLRDTETDFEMPVTDLRVVGDHNLANASAAALSARLIGIAPETIASTLRHYEGLPHRMALVSVVQGVRYIDDSKATNVGAATAALTGLGEGRVVLIAGGVDKGGSYAPLVEEMKKKGRALVVIGAAAVLIEQAFADSGMLLRRADSMHQAVQTAAQLATGGDTVLLAPACASFDMFASYAARGDAFVDAVQSLGGGNG